MVRLKYLHKFGNPGFSSFPESFIQFQCQGVKIFGTRTITDNCFRDNFHRFMDPTKSGGLMIRPIDVLHQIPDLIHNQSSADRRDSPSLVRANSRTLLGILQVCGTFF